MRFNDAFYRCSFGRVALSFCNDRRITDTTDSCNVDDADDALCICICTGAKMYGDDTQTATKR